MNRKLSIFLLLILTSLSTFADEVSMSEAWIKAQPYIKEQSSMARSMQRMTGISEEKSQSQPLYIFSRGAGEGFVVVSGDDCLPAIIGFTESGDYDEEKMPPALKAIINHYAEAVLDAQARGTNIPYSAVTGSTYDQDISPLLTSHWHQSAPWNNMCPQRSDGGGRALTGCVATAAAQIAYYWRNEGLNAVSQYDTPTYSYGDAPVTSVIVKKGTPFNWETMADNSTDVSGNAAMARLCVLMGTCAYLTYGASTGGYIWNMQDVFENQIGMNRGEYVTKYGYSQVGWEKMVISDLMQGRPILYSSYNKDKEDWDGHAYVVDGYRTSDNTFHINLGWGNGWDGYWTMAETDKRDGMAGRPDDQSMVYQLYPQNMNRTFSVDIVGGGMYQNLENKIAVSVENNSSLEIQGVYLLSCNTSSLLPSSKPDTLAYYDKPIKKGECLKDTVVYFTPYTNTSGLYFYLLDKNKSVLYSTETPVPVQTSRASVKLHSVQIDSNGSEEKTFKYNGEEGNHTVYKVESSGMSMKANISNDISSGRFRSTHCVPVFTAVISSIDEDGNCQVVSTTEEKDTVFEVNDVKDIPFEFYNLEPNVLYKASISAKVGNGLGNLMQALNYDTERADTMAFFMLTGSDMKVDRVDGRVTISGTTFDRLVYRGIANDATVTSIDMRSLETTVPADVPKAANPNAIVYVNNSIQQSSNVVIDGVCQNLVLRQGYDYDPAADFTAVKATVKIAGQVCTSSSYYWNTIILPFTVQTPKGMLARYYADDTKNTEAHAETLLAGTPYVYLMTHNIESIEAENVDVYSRAGMPASIGYDGYVGTFGNMETDGTQALSTGTAFAMAESGIKIPAFTAYRINAISLENMNRTRGVDNAMHNLVMACVQAREVLEQYRSERTPTAIAAFETAISDAETTLTALPGVFNDISSATSTLSAAQEKYLNPEPEYLRGDVNGDDVVNGTDIQAVINFIVTDVYDAKADVNEDGFVNGTDIQEIINIIVSGE